jgi:hypothetical protein
MKIFLSAGYKVIPYILLGSSAIALFGGMIIYRQEYPTAMNGWLMGYSIAAFVIGMAIIVSQWRSGIFGLGLLIFFILLGISIGFSDKYDLAGCGIPLSIIFLIGWIIWFTVGLDQVRNNSILKNGISAPGIIINCKRTGNTMRVNTDYPNYGVELLIKVLPQNEPDFISKAETMLAEHEIANITEGMPVTVRYNPKDKGRVSIETW